MKVDVVDVGPEKRKYIRVGLGMVLIIIAFLLLFEYIIHFVKIFIGIVLLFVGIFLIWDEKFFRRRFNGF